MVAHASATELIAVTHEIVLLCSDIIGTCFQEAPILFEESREGVVSRLPAALLGIPLQQRKLIDPAIRKHIRIGQTKSPAEIVTNRRERFGHDWRHVGDSEYEIARLGPDLRRDRGNLRFAQELGDGRANAVRINREGGKSFRPGSSRNLRKLVDLPAGVPGTTGDDDGLDLTASSERLGERTKCCPTKGVRHIMQLETEAKIGSVATEPVHGIVVCQAWERSLQDALLAEPLGQPEIELFDQRHDVRFFDESHLYVELRELRLPVSALGFISEAAGDLEVAVEPSHHQELLHLLRRLGQGVKVTGEAAAGDKEV